VADSFLQESGGLSLEGPFGVTPSQETDYQQHVDVVDVEAIRQALETLLLGQGRLEALILSIRDAVTQHMSEVPEKPSCDFNLVDPTRKTRIQQQSSKSGTARVSQETLAHLMLQHQNDSTQSAFMKPRSRTAAIPRSGTNLERATGRFKPIHPNSMFRAGFDFSSLLVLLTESVLIPYALAFPVASDGWMNVLDQAMMCFWTVDLVLGFVTGYYCHGNLVMEFKAIAKHNLRNLFWADLGLVLSDYFALFLKQAEGGHSTMIKIARVLKVNRFLRMANLMRTGRLAHMHDLTFNYLLSFGLAGSFKFTLAVSKLVVGMLWLAHLGCCLWYAIGQQSVNNWYGMTIKKVRSQQNHTMGDFAQQDSLFQYLLTFYWSMASMVSGGSAMPPSRWEELLFSVIFVLFGLIVGGSIISSMAALLVQFTETQKEHTERLAQLRRFLHENEVPMKVAFPIEKQARERAAQQKRVANEDVQMFNLLSADLRIELDMYLYEPTLARNQFIAALSHQESLFLEYLFAEALSHKVYNAGMCVFDIGTEAEGLYMVQWGFLSYRSLSGMPEDVKKWASLSEAALWVKWSHVGLLEAVEQSEVILIRSSNLKKILQCFTDLKQFLIECAEAVQHQLSTLDDCSKTDLAAPLMESVMVLLPSDSRWLLSAPALQVLSKTLRGKKLHELEQEVLDGKCNVILNDLQKVHRMVAVIALELKRSDGKILAQLGKINKSMIEWNCKLPGCKIPAHVRAKEALDAFLDKRMSTIKSAIRIDKYEFMPGSSEISDQFGIPTKYMRNVCYGSINEETEELDSKTRNCLHSNIAFCLPDSEDPNKHLIVIWFTREELNEAATCSDVDHTRTQLSLRFSGHIEAHALLQHKCHPLVDS